MLLLGAGCLAAVCLLLTAVGVGAWWAVARVNEQAADGRQEPTAEPGPPPAPEQPQVPALPEAPLPRRKPMLPLFIEPVNPYKPGTQTRLREIRALELPAVALSGDVPLEFPNPAHAQVLFSPKHQLLFVRRAAAVWTYDLGRNMALQTRPAMDFATDMSLAPDESALFVIDFGGDARGGLKPPHDSRVHRFDPVARTWEDHKVTKPSAHIRAVGDNRFLLGHPSGLVTLNLWEKGERVREIAWVGLGGPNLEYSPRAGHLYQLDGSLIMSAALDGDSFIRFRNQSNLDIAYGPVSLSADGARIYSGPFQMDVERVGRVARRFPQLIYAASRDVAFGLNGYFDARTGERLGDYPFKADQSIQPRPFGPGWYCPPVVSVSPDGMSVWIIDRDKNTARQFALEGDR